MKLFLLPKKAEHYFYLKKKKRKEKNVYTIYMDLKSIKHLRASIIRGSKSKQGRYGKVNGFRNSTEASEASDTGCSRSEGKWSVEGLSELREME